MTQRPVNSFSSPEALAKALAAGVAAGLVHGIHERGQATLIVSGGSTPKLFLTALSEIEIDWPSVTVMLADERWVPHASARSNAAMVHKTLLKRKAAAAVFISFHQAKMSVEQAARLAADAVSERPRPLDAVVLGMGLDGHTASLFPDAPNISVALSPGAPPAMEIYAASQPEPRITLSLQTLTSARFLALHIEGAAKRVALEAADREGPPEEMPVRAVLHNEITPVQIYWCP